MKGRAKVGVVKHTFKSSRSLLKTGVMRTGIWCKLPDGGRRREEELATGKV
jgi:hypothetical protein